MLNPIERMLHKLIFLQFSIGLRKDLGRETKALTTTSNFLIALSWLKHYIKRSNNLASRNERTQKRRHQTGSI
jgi:hypothetical protein